MCLALGAEVNDASCWSTKKKGNSPWRASLATEKEELREEGEGDCYKHPEENGKPGDGIYRETKEPVMRERERERENTSSQAGHLIRLLDAS